MDQIERQVVLPEGAEPITSYARYYAETGKGKITAAYLIPIDHELRPGESCEEVLEDFTTREIPCEIMRYEWEIPAGQRQWINDPLDLPYYNDGGCMQVTVVFDKAKAAIESVECNGFA